MVLLTRKDLVHLRVVPTIKNGIQVPEWISVPLSPDLGGYFFTSSEFGAEPDQTQVLRGLQWRYQKSSLWVKKIFTLN